MKKTRIMRRGLGLAAALALSAALLSGCQNYDMGNSPTPTGDILPTLPPGNTAAPAKSPTPSPMMTPDMSPMASGMNSYESSADGKNGPVTVRVTCSKDKIESVEVVKHSETPAYADAALEEIPDAIVKAQSADVDVVAGAT